MNDLRERFGRTQPGAGYYWGSEILKALWRGMYRSSCSAALPTSYLNTIFRLARNPLTKVSPSCGSRRSAAVVLSLIVIDYLYARIIMYPLSEGEGNRREKRAVYTEHLSERVILLRELSDCRSTALIRHQ